MELFSTRRQAPLATLQEAVFKGLPDDNGLFMPSYLPVLPPSVFAQMHRMSLPEIAFEVSRVLLEGEIPEADLQQICQDAFPFPAPVHHLTGSIQVLELFHGPTLAFKDFGARFMSRLMGHYLKRSPRPVHILVATSGDTGSAVAQGFYGVEGIRVTILFPRGKVSQVQEKQLTTVGGNVDALEVEGNFDDCQRMVKEAFLDAELAARLGLTSANSINISRLIPQSFYYFYAWAQVEQKGLPVVFCVPSGNFGNLCGGLIAHKMGLPVHAFIAATNANDVVPEYLETGMFHPRPSVQTLANAMDVGNPSNFPRMTELYHHSWEQMRAEISGAAYSDEQIVQTMRRVYEQTGYEMCPHSAIGYRGLSDWMAAHPEPVTGIFLATAHPAKFPDVVEQATDQPVVVPERLQEIISRPSQATRIPNTFQALKEYLLS